MFTHSKVSQHNGLGQHGDNWSPGDMSDSFDQENGQVSLTSADPFGAGLFGQVSGVSSFFAPPGAASGLSWGGDSMVVPAWGLHAGTLVSVSTPGSGLVFNNTYASGCTAQYETCIVAAEKQLENLFSNSDTINITFNEANSGNNGVALSNSFGYYNYSYATLKSALLAVAPGDVLPSTDPSGGGNWFVPEAYARMLGLTTATGSPDLSVSLNTYYSWDFGQDVINGLTHEMSEGGLGRVGNLGPKGAGSSWSTMDLFRYNAAGQADYSNGRDGDTTYFSSNGGTSLSNENLPGKGAPTLSYNNQYDTTGTKVNGGDTADWVQQSVFGSTGGGETLNLTQTELDVLQALGWHLTLKQDVDSTSGSWETPTNWSTGSMPIDAQDVYINGAVVSLDSDVIVNSIATSTGGILTIGDSASTTLTAVGGTILNSEDTSSVASGNLGTIDVYTGSALQIGFFSETFDNAGTIVLGKGAGGNGSGAGALNIAGEVDMSGGGTITLGQPGTAGDILNAPGVSSDTLVNVNNTISGGGVIGTSSFDNQADGVVEAQSFLQIVSSSFSNEGLITDEANATLAVGQDGAAQSFTNAGSVFMDAGSSLAVSGNYTVTGAGTIDFKGAGAAIRSDGLPATFTNASIINAEASGQIGDANMIFDNTGTTNAAGSGVTLTLNTGANAITNTGTFQAGSNATLAIASNLINSGTLQAGTTSSTANTTGTIDLGVDGASETAANSGAINILAGSGLAISGNYTVGGGGSIQLKGAGAAITSDGNAPATFTNASEIQAFDSGAVQIGDAGIKAANDLTFINTGSVFATGSSATLTINTGANTVNDSSGLFEAVNGGTLVIDSGVSTGVGGTIEAAASGTLVANGAVSGIGTLSSGTVSGGVLDLAGGGSFAGAITGLGTVVIAGATTLHAGASLSAANVVETASLTLASVSITNTAADVFALTASSGTTITLESTGTGNFVNAGTMLVNGAGTAHVTAPLVDAGTISVTSGMLLDTGKLSGSGALSVGSGATAYLMAGGVLTEAISGAGLLELGGTYLLAGGDLTVGTVEVNALHSLSGRGTLGGAVIDRGTVASSGTTLTVGGPISGTGTVSAGAGSVLDLAGGGSFAGTISGAGTVAIAGATTLTPGARLLAAHVADTANLKLAGVAVTNAAGDVFNLTAASASTVTLSSTGAGAFTNAGSLVANGAGTAAVSAPFTNTGTVSALSGTLSFLGSVAGTGTLDVGAAGTLSLGLGASSGQTVDFLASTGALDLSHPLDFAGTINGFGGSDSIFLANTSFTGFSFANDLLTVKHGTTTVASLNITESSNLFTLTSASSGVLITFH